jgi:hypothetical protein
MSRRERCSQIARLLFRFFAVIAIIFFVSFALAVSYIIVKPREAGFVANYLMQHLNEVDEDISVNIDKVILSWNKEKFNIDLKIYDFDVEILEKEVLEIPELVININHSFFIGRAKLFIVDLYDLDLEIGESLFADDFVTSEDVKKDYDFLAYLQLFEKIYISNSKFRLGGDEEEFNIDKIAFAVLRKNGLDSLSLLGNVQYEIYDFPVDVECNIDSNQINDCKFILNNINSTYSQIVNLSQYITADFNFDLQCFARFKDGNFSSSSCEFINLDPGSIKISPENPAIDFERIFVRFDFNKDLSEFNIESLEFNNLSSNLIFSGKFAKGEEIEFAGNIKAKDFSVIDAEKYWPVSLRPSLRKWLLKSLEAGNITDSEVDFKVKYLQDAQKFAVEKLDIDVDFIDTRLAFSDKFLPLRNASGHIKFVNQRMDINFKNVELAGMKAQNLTASLANVGDEKGILNISSDISGKSENLLRFVAEKNLKKDHYNFWQKFLRGSEHHSKIELALRLNKKISQQDIKLDMYQKFSHLNNSLLKDDSQVLSVVSKKFGDSKFHIKPMLQDAKVVVERFNYQKKKGQDVKASFSIISNHKIMAINEIELKSHDLLVEGDMELANGRFRKLSFPKFQFGRNNFLVMLANDAMKTVKVSGSEIDLSNILKWGASGGKNKLNYIADIKLDRAHMPSGEKVSDVQGIVNCKSDCEFMLFSAKLSQDSEVNVKLQTDEKGRNILLETNDAGKLLNVLDSSDRIIGGKLKIEALQKKGEADYLADFELKSFSVARVKLFNELSKIKAFSWVEEELIKNGKVYFETGRGKMRMMERNVELTNFAASGNLVGITSKGNIDLNAHNLDLEGVLVPAYKINSLLGLKNIPFVGKILTGGEGEGLFSVSYKMQGDYTKNVDIKFNPLSATTPSFLRKIFDVIDFVLPGKKEKKGDSKKTQKK